MREEAYNELKRKRTAVKGMATRALRKMLDAARQYNHAVDTLADLNRAMAEEWEKEADSGVKEALGIEQ